MMCVKFKVVVGMLGNVRWLVAVWIPAVVLVQHGESRCIVVIVLRIIVRDYCVMSIVIPREWYLFVNFRFFGIGLGFLHG